MKLVLLAAASGLLLAPVPGALAEASCAPCCPSATPCDEGAPCEKLAPVACCEATPAAPAAPAERAGKAPAGPSAAPAPRTRPASDRSLRSPRAESEVALRASPLRLSVVLLI